MAMTASMNAGSGRWRAGPAARLAIAAAAGLCLLVSGCSGGSGASSSAGTSAGGSGSVRRVAGAPAPASAGGSRKSLATLSTQSSQAIIYTATVTVRAKDVTAAAGQASHLAQAAGGYVANETTHLDPAHPARSTVRLELKIPVGSYQATLSAVSTRLGTQVAVSRRAQDVTQSVADVTSRVASAKAAIAALRRLLSRAGSVSGLLQVQNQIDREQADLESLLAQQRSLAHQTTYATISVVLETAAAPAHARSHRAGGFTGGLAAGWRALVAVVSWLLTALGAVLPFAVPLGLLAFLAYLARRRWSRRGAGPRPAG